ncbi:MAG: carotenoid oxygenase family protein [Acidimicrobiales bacterium]
MAVTEPRLGRVTNDGGQPFLAGNLFPVDRELDAPCEVVGTLPEGLAGTFVRNGPNPMFEPLGKYHMFDGDGMLHSVVFGQGTPAYRNRWIRTAALEAEMRQGRALYHGLAELFEFPDPKLVGDAGPIKNPANTHIIRHAGRHLALWEGGPPTEVTADLDTIGLHDFDGRLVGGMTAHPRLDPRTGEMLFFAYSPIPPYLRYHVADATGALVHSIEIELPAPVMMHDFVITESYAILLDSPARFDLSGEGDDMMRWQPELGCRLGVLPRLGGPDEVRWFDIEPGHVQHFWNAWEDGDRIVLSGSRLGHADFGMDSGGDLDDSSADATAGRPADFWIDLAAGTAGWTPRDDLGGDFCRINDEYDGVRNRFDYMAAFLGDNDVIGDFDTIVKYDNVSGERTLWHAGADGHVGEAVFAPDPAGSAEDDGWLLSAVYDSARDTSEVVVLDARDVAAGPIARVRIPQRMPFGFHANWFAADA